MWLRRSHKWQQQTVTPKTGVTAHAKTDPRIDQIPCKHWTVAQWKDTKSQMCCDTPQVSQRFPYKHWAVGLL